MRLIASGKPGEFLGGAAAEHFEHDSVFRYKGVIGGSPYLFAYETKRTSSKGILSTMHGAAFFNYGGTFVTLVYDHRSKDQLAFAELPQRFQEFSEWHPRRMVEAKLG